MSGVHKKGQPIRKSALVLGRRVSSSFSKKSDPEKRSSRPTIRLIDETGVDLTPLPLLNEEKRIREEKDIVSTEISQASNYSGSSLHITNPFTFTRSYVSGSSPTGESHSEGSEEADRYRAYTEVKTLIQSQQEILTEADLNKLVDVVIIETETFWIFDQPPTYVSQESSEAKDQIRRNEAYKALVASKIGNDRYTELGMNTFNPPSISKLVQTERIGIQEKSTMATNWDMADTYEEEKKKLLEGEHEMNSHHVNVKAGAHKTKLDENNTAHQIIKREQLQADDGGPLEDIYATGGDTAVSNPETSLEVESSQLGQSATTTTTKNTMGSNSESDIMGFRDSSISHLSQMTNVLGLLETPKMKKDLNHMERALNLNTYYDKLLKYQSLVLSRYLTQACLDQADTDPSSTVGRTPVVSVPPTLDDNSAEHAIFVSKAPGASNVPAVTSARSLGSVNPTIAGSQGASSVRTNEVAKMEDANLENPHTVPLWRFHCPLTKGHNVSDMAWNKQNPNIVAVGYGQFEYDNQRKGLVCCWSLKFIEYPERYYETPSSVTAVGWSKIHANLLAVGMFSGVIYVYDVRKNDPVPVIDTTHATGRHLGPVRKLQWIVRESGRAQSLSEVLVSVSSDGRVTQWFVRKGFESTDLMVLKRAYANSLTPLTASKRNEALISRTAFATSMAFNKRDPSIYVVGTEEGPIHRCSCSYNEQYLDTYHGHAASVYQIEWSPFIPEVFLSCSADMTMKLWHTDHRQPLITIQTNMTTISSISWSPHNSLIFAAANEGLLEIWNLDHSTVDPYVAETVSVDTNMTSVIFSETSQSVLIGDDQGTVHVYHLSNPPDSPVKVSEQVFQLNQFLNTCFSNLQ